MEKIPIPDTINLISEDGNEATFEVTPYFPGYGATLGNALRRVLLSSLPGAAAVSVRIEGVEHEFSTLPGVKEDIVSILLTIKRLRVNVHSDEPVELSLKVKGKKTGEKVVTAADFDKNSDVEVVNSDLVIAHLTDEKAELDMRVKVQRGRGYIPTERREDENRDIGEIAIDAVYTPVERVSFRVENVRVGQETEYHKLTMTIRTDGSVSPKDALKQAASILEDHFKSLAEGVEERLTELRTAAPEPAPEESQKELPSIGEHADQLFSPTEEVVEEGVVGAVRAPAEREREVKSTPVVQLDIGTRIQNILEKEGIRTVAGLIQKNRSQLLEMEGLGEKAVDEIEKSVIKLGLSLREES